MTTNEGAEMSTHAVFATTAAGERVRVTDPASWNWAQAEWKRMDDARRSRQFPTVKFFEVRSMDDPAYKDSPVSLGHGTPVEVSRGFGNVRDAARRAWLLWQGQPRKWGVEQGSGGWFFWHNGRTAARGLDELTDLAKARGLVEQGVDGRWYPMVSKL